MATGRKTYRKPRIQNIPIRSKLGREIRRAFIEDGHVFHYADYLGLELRIAEQMAKEKKSP